MAGHACRCLHVRARCPRGFRAAGGRAGSPVRRRRIPRRREEAGSPGALRDGRGDRFARRIPPPHRARGDRGTDGRRARQRGGPHLHRSLRGHSRNLHHRQRSPDHRSAQHPGVRRSAGRRPPGRGAAELGRRARGAVLHRSRPPAARRGSARGQLGRLRQRGAGRRGVADHPQRPRPARDGGNSSAAATGSATSRTEATSASPSRDSPRARLWKRSSTSASGAPALRSGTATETRFPTPRTNCGTAW